jgi:signal transduction histidine kinase
VGINKIIKNLLLIIVIISISACFSSKKEKHALIVGSNDYIINDSILELKIIKLDSLYLNKDYFNSLELALELIELSKSLKKSNILLNSTFLVGDIFEKTKNNKKSLVYYKEALNLFLKVNFKDSVVNEDLNESDLAKYSYSKNLLKIGGLYQKLDKNDSATIFYQKLVELKDNKNNVLRIKAKAYNNLSGISIQENDFELAKNYATKAIDIHSFMGDKIDEAAALGNLGTVYLLEGNYDKSKEFYFKGLDLVGNNKSTNAVNFKKSLLGNVALSLFSLKDYNSYTYLKKSYKIKDSLRDVNIHKTVEDIYARSKVDIEEQRANLVKYQADLEKAQERKTNWFLGILMVLVLGISGFVLYTYKLRQRNLKLKLEQTEFAQKSKLDKLKSESQVRILNATLDGKETERKQIAETLHDSVSSLLSSANLHLQATKMQFNGDTPIEIDKTQKIIIEASQTIRDLSHTLVSSVLLKFGLKYAIKDMAEKYSNSQLKIDTNIKNVRRYHQGFEIKVNNIVQEFVNNILKHSNATKALVRVEDKEGVLHINIQDDGEGFDKRDIPKKDGLGINQIDARIQMMKGKFLINSSAETGTIIEIELPIKEKETTVSA